MLRAIYLQQELPMWMMNFHPENPFYWKLKLPNDNKRESMITNLIKDPNKLKMYQEMKKTVLSDPCYMRIVKEVIEESLEKMKAEGKKSPLEEIMED